jgi:multimeric flavodoxin WrbA
MANENKKVLILLGSPRKNGNSAALAERIAAGAESAGAHVESLFINGMNIKPCQACWKCQSPDSKGCVIKDDMQQVFPKLVEADAWVIATPVHWFNMSTQTKLWMDRCFSLVRYGEKAFKKKIGIAITYGDTDPFSSGAVNALRCFQDSFKYVGATITGIVHASATNAGDVRQNTEVLAAAEDLGKKLVI